MSKLVDYVNGMDDVITFYVFMIDIVVFLIIFINRTLLVDIPSWFILYVWVLFIMFGLKTLFLVKQRNFYFYRALTLSITIIMLIFVIEVLVLSVIDIEKILLFLLGFNIFTIVGYVFATVLQLKLIRSERKIRISYYPSFVGVSLVLFWGAGGFRLIDIEQSDNYNLLLIPFFLIVSILIYTSSKLLLNAYLYKKIN
jgi:hypothetical protein